MNETFDKIETAILGMLQPLPTRMSKIEPTDKPFSIQKDGALIATETDRWKDLNLKPIDINFPWAFTMSSDRWIATDPEYWLLPLPELLKYPLATVCFGEEVGGDCCVRYQHLNPIKRLPRQYYTIRKNGLLFWELREIKIDDGMRSKYMGELFAWSEKRQRSELILPRGYSLHSYKIARTNGNGGDDDDSLRIRLFAGVADSFLNTWHVDIWQDRGIKLSTDGEGIRELAQIREGPRTSTGRKRPILHWVKRHMRKKSRSDGEIEIPRHLRGLEEFEIDDFMFRIVEPQKQVGLRK